MSSETLLWKLAFAESRSSKMCVIVMNNALVILAPVPLGPGSQKDVPRTPRGLPKTGCGQPSEGLLSPLEDLKCHFLFSLKTRCVFVFVLRPWASAGLRTRKHHFWFPQETGSDILRPSSLALEGLLRVREASLRRILLRKGEKQQQKSQNV